VARRLMTELRTAIADGVFMEEAVDSVGRSQADQWLLFDQNHKRNVTRAYKELEWE